MKIPETAQKQTATVVFQSLLLLQTNINEPVDDVTPKS